VLRQTFKQFKLQAITIAIFACLISSNGMFAQETALQPEQNASQQTVPVPVESMVMLTPANSRISFVGTHVGDDPKPRLGGFSKFSGQLKVDPAKKTITSLAIDIKIDSVWTEFAKLTAHLKNADFFDVAKFPNSRFVSTEIKLGQDGNCTVTGDLTLHGQTGSITFPASYQFGNGGLLFASKFRLDRSQFGMDQMLSGVEKAVELEIFVGQKTTIPQAQEGHGGDSQKKQSKVELPTERQQVSINLPNMT
jgi:polyisoprenoid-binding protein YceI